MIQIGADKFRMFFRLWLPSQNRFIGDELARRQEQTGAESTQNKPERHVHVLASPGVKPVAESIHTFEILGQKHVAPSHEVVHCGPETTKMRVFSVGLW